MFGSLSCVSSRQFFSPFKLVSSSQIHHPLPWPASEESMKLKYAFTILQGFLKISPEVPTSNYLCLDSICSPNLFPSTNLDLSLDSLSEFYLSRGFYFYPVSWNVFLPSFCSFSPSIFLCLVSPSPLVGYFSQEWPLVWLIHIPRSLATVLVPVWGPLCHVLHNSRDWPYWGIEGTGEITDTLEKLGPGGLRSQMEKPRRTFILNVYYIELNGGLESLPTVEQGRVCGRWPVQGNRSSQS